MNASSATITGSGNAFGHRRLLGVRDQQLRRTVLDPQPDAVGAEQRKERDGNGAELDRAEDGDVERTRWFEHHGDAIAGGHAVRSQVVREPRRLARDVGERDRLVAAVGVRQDHGRPIAVDMAVDALVRDVQRVAGPVEQFPQLFGRPELGRVRVRRVVGELEHGYRAGPTRCCK
jgi:hypothetical protein